ncbi:MAG TPA: 3-methyl-2-oxobutanoate hydroxymethyltransferase, partial [bacterium]|nr:3-methyl-2-oxobutanoate hydroxymethyltransferase [bacterium]
MNEGADKRVTAASLKGMKASGKKIVVETGYDYPLARILDRSGVDVVLVGDSLGMVVLGHESTVPVTMADMVHHTRAVARGCRRALITADLPFLSCDLGPDEAVRNA